MDREEKIRQIEKTIEKVRPYIQNDGGDVQFVKLEDDIVYVSVHGACVGCMALDYTLKEGVDKDEAVKLIASKLEPLVGQIPGLLKMEVRRCFAGMDYALYSEFEKKEDVKAYRAHPLHQEAKSHFHHMLATRVSADYEV